MDNQIKKFLQDNKLLYFEWLRKYANSFPFCCHFSSNVLTSYLQVNFNQGESIYGNWRDFNHQDGKSFFDTPHSWVLIGEDIVDFTFMQFSLPDPDFYGHELLNVNSYDLLEKYTNELDDNIFVNNSKLKELYIIPEWHDIISELSFKKYALNVNFESYLKKLEPIVTADDFFHL